MKETVLKWALIAVMLISALFVLIAGIWMIMDLESAARVLLAIEAKNVGVNDFKFDILAKITGKSFLMLGIYYLLTCYLLYRNHDSALGLSFATGLMITSISITTFLDTHSSMVWVTDTSRGLAILVLTVLYRKSNRKRIKGLNE